MSAPLLQDFQTPGAYELALDLRHDDIIPFIKEYYQKKVTPLLLFHWGFSLITLLVWLGVGVLAGLDADGWIGGAGWAVLGFFALLPLHEWIHGLVYKQAGASDVRYGASLRQFVFYAIAHHFVASRQAFVRVALAPFVLITLPLVVGMIFLPDLRFVLAGCLALHTSGTAGDFALLNFYVVHRQREIYTYDDADQKRSYFYFRIP